MKNISAKLKNPVSLIQRTLYKTIVGPIVYGEGNDYDAQRYWRDRFSKYGHSLKGVGHEGLSEQENEKAYAEAAKVFIDVCHKENIAFQSARVLEIGCGTGFYTQILHDLGVNSYLGVDITDVLFPELRKKFPHFEFLRKDVTTDVIEEKFDLIVMIDVIEHIVEASKIISTMDRVKSCLSRNGVFLVAPIVKVKRKELFYVKFWSDDDIKKNFTGYNFGELVPFRNGYLTTVKNDHSRC